MTNRSRHSRAVELIDRLLESAAGSVELELKQLGWSKSPGGAMILQGDGFSIRALVDVDQDGTVTIDPSVSSSSDYTSSRGPSTRTQTQDGDLPVLYAEDGERETEFAERADSELRSAAKKLFSGSDLPDDAVGPDHSYSKDAPLDRF